MPHSEPESKRSCVEPRKPRFLAGTHWPTARCLTADATSRPVHARTRASHVTGAGSSEAANVPGHHPPDPDDGSGALVAGGRERCSAVGRQTCARRGRSARRKLGRNSGPMPTNDLDGRTLHADSTFAMRDGDESDVRDVCETATHEFDRLAGAECHT